MSTLPLKIHIAAPLAASLAEMASLRGQHVEQFCGEIVETAAIEFRRKKLPPCVLSNARAQSSEPIEDRRVKMTPAQVQRLLHLREVEGLSVEVIAQRIGASRTSVRRVLYRHAASAIRVPTPHAVHGQAWGDSGGREARMRRNGEIDV